jgi:hypothetical protein
MMTRQARFIEQSTADKDWLPPLHGKPVVIDGNEYKLGIIGPYYDGSIARLRQIADPENGFA